MKIVRKSNAQSSNSAVTDDGHGPPLIAKHHSRQKKYSRDPVSPSFKRADFSTMSRQELHDLIHCQMRSGQLSLEDSAVFTWLSATVRIDTDVESGELDKQVNLDFIESARLGMDAALADSNTKAARQFETALKLMSEIQGQTIGVDTLV